MSRFLMSGCTGKMGKSIIGFSEASPDLEYAFGWSRSAEGSKEVRSLKDVDPKKVDIVIDFSLPVAFSEILQWSIEHKKPFMSGTTGLSPDQTKAFKGASKEIATLLAANTSLGVNFVNGLLKSLSQLEGFDFQIVEAHHNKKVDAPSGTAVLLQDSLKLAVGEGVPEPLSVRGGGIFGIHEVLAMSDEEVISIKHTALTRSVFAKGALKAASWLVKQPPGAYSMNDVLGV